MIEFYGKISENCRIETEKRITKNNRILFSSATTLASAVVLIIGIIYETWIYSIIIITLLIAVALFATKTRKNNVSRFCDVIVKITIDNEQISKTSSIDVLKCESFNSKKISKIKKVIDMGDWYYIFFNGGDITNVWICQKNLIIKGSIEDFEKIFQNKLIRGT